MNAGPTIKGIFVNSHIKAVRDQKGDEGLRKLEYCFGKSIVFKNLDDVPVRDEVKLIECAVAILSDRAPVPEHERPRVAGRLHFKNFSTTPLGRIIFSVFRYDFTMMMLKAANVARRVFRGVEFSSEARGPHHVVITMAHADYPIDHFKGFFEEWMQFAGCRNGTVSAAEPTPHLFVYHLTWE